ncbi:MAG: ABC transporter ATP-binding protein [Propionibacteriaceae bacterium]|nr:ABC transporter ATP-binding protein [Propionibacteriaceae bacterium]
MTPILEVHNLAHSYGSIVAVDSISFTVDRGSVFAFVGPNGAGKSTSISIVTTILSKQTGTVAYSIIDHDPKLVGEDDAAIRSRIGVVFQDSLLDRALSVRSNLLTRARLYGLDDIDEVVKRLELTDIVHRKYGTLSGGQRRRVDIARALLTSPEILFLDEPTTGLDPQSRNLVWETIDTLRQDCGLTVFLTTHYMEEAEQADMVVVIDHGRIIASGTPDDLRARYSHDTLKIRTAPGLEEELTEVGLGFTRVRDVIHLEVANSGEALEILKSLEGFITDFEVVHGTMDDVFLRLTGTNLRED